jgi:hypothetical protein
VRCGPRALERDVFTRVDALAHQTLTRILDLAVTAAVAHTSQLPIFTAQPDLVSLAPGDSEDAVISRVISARVATALPGASPGFARVWDLVSTIARHARLTESPEAAATAAARGGPEVALFCASVTCLLWPGRHFTTAFLSIENAARVFEIARNSPGAGGTGVA